MGRLPATFADCEVKDRFPYALEGEMAMATASRGVQFPDALFTNGTDKPFECHRMIPRLYARASNNTLLVTQPDQELLAGLIRLDIVINNLEQKLTKAPSLVGTLTKGSAERTWEFADPCYLVRSSGFQVTVDSVTYPAIENLNNILVSITFQGFLLVIHPPTPNR